MERVRADRCAALAALWLAGSTLAMAAVPASPAAFGEPDEGWQPAYLEVVVNAVPEGQPLLVQLAGGDVAVPLELLKQREIDRLGGRRFQLGGKVWVSLRSLAPRLRYELDERAIALRITVDPTILRGTSVDLAEARRPEGLARLADASAFLNYSLQGRSDRQLSAFLEAGASQGGNLLLSGLSRLPDGSWVRGLTSLTRDDAGRLARFTLGDAAVNSGAMGGAGVLSGIGFAREFSIDPYFIPGPLPRTSGLATTPSTVEVYVNGVLVKQQQVAPGSFEISHLPVTTGAGNVRTVVRDAFGRTEELDARYYYSSGLLATGRSDFGYYLGLRRDRIFDRSFEYGAPLAVARHRWGLSDRSTAGLRLEAGLEGVSGGASTTTALPLGEVEAVAAASGAGTARGAAGSLAWSYYARQAAVGVYVRAQSERYTSFSLLAASDREVLRAGGFLGLPIGGRASLNLDLSSSRMRDSGDLLSGTLRLSVPLGRTVNLDLTGGATRSSTAGGAFTSALALSWATGPASNAQASFDTGGPGGAGGTAGAQRSLPVGAGYGYRFKAGSEGGEALASGLLQVQEPYGRVEAGFDRYGAGNLASGTVSGALLAIGGGVFPTLPVTQSYGLIQVPGVEGVRGYLENREVGRTDARGNLLVPNLLPYYANKLSIRSADLPLDYDLRSTELTLAPPRRGGALARFDVTRIQAVTGSLRLEGPGPSVPANGVLALNDGNARVSSPVTPDGRFWVERLSPGKHRAEVEWGGGRCVADLEVPERAERVLEVGSILCRSALDSVAQRALDSDLAAP